jgi:hypothetical protein
MEPNTQIPNQYQELLSPYDIIDLPSNGILYKNKLSKVKVEYLNALDESILTSPNIMRNGKFIDVLVKRKVKDLNGLDHIDLLLGDRIAIIMYLRISGFGPIYKVPIQLTDGSDRVVDGEVDLTTIKTKQLSVQPNESGEFEFTLPMSKKVVKFRLLTGRDELDIDAKDEIYSQRNGDGISEKARLRLESMIMEVDGVRDKIKISTLLNKIPLGDSLALKKYYAEIEPGLDLNVDVRIPGGGSIKTFLPIGPNFFWIE